MKLKKPLEQILLEKGKIDSDDLAKVRQAKGESGEDIEKILIKMKITSEKEIAEAISEEISIPFLDLENFIIDPAVLSYIDEKTARRLDVLPIYIVKDTLTVAMADPQNIIAQDDIRTLSGFKKVQTVMGTRSAIHEAIEQSYTLGNTLDDIVKPLQEKGMVYAPASGLMPHILSSLAGQPPVVKFVNQMIFEALKNRASDIHIEPAQDKIRVRYRVDGVLFTAVDISRDINLPIVPRIKILSGMDIAESRRPQDGRFSVTVAGRHIDLRVAVFPMSYGESASIRLLDRTVSLIEIEDLGLSQEMLKKFQKLIKSTYGIILVTGPTGSGKTTTLYAVLNRISSPEKNILTIEDPIEYTLKNVNQAQVNLKINLDFAAALRSFLRQDPDIIMVGEIRDNESASIAFRAAITGHLILSTLHTNDAPTAVMRLKDLGLDKDMISSSVVCVLAQRLLRTICPSCREEYRPDKKLFEDLEVEYDPKVKYYRGAGCDDCRGTGYKGRTGIFELLEFNDEIKILIQKDTPLEDIRRVARKAGMKALKEGGLDKVKKGITTIEEVIRVTQD